MADLLLLCSQFLNFESCKKINLKEDKWAKMLITLINSVRMNNERGVTLIFLRVFIIWFMKALEEHQ